MVKVAKYWKAIAAGLAAGAGSLSTALADDRITSAEGRAVAVAVLAASGITWWVPNRAPKDQE